MKRGLVLASLLLAALTCYTIGSAETAGALAAVGVLFETAFWIGLFGKKPAAVAARRADRN